MLSLNPTHALESRLLRRDLLQLFDVKEFAAEATFKNPSASCVVDVVCDACAAPRTLDLCRDEELLACAAVASASGDGEGGGGGDGGGGGTAEWPPCPSCSAPTDRLRIEERLIARVQALVVRWQTQDVRCSNSVKGKGKCGRVQSDVGVLMEHCVCGGAWVGGIGISKNGVREEIKVLDGVARGYGLRMLRGVVEGVRGRI